MSAVHVSVYTQTSAILGPSFLLYSLLLKLTILMIDRACRDGVDPYQE